MTQPLDHADLEEVLAATTLLWNEMRGQRLFLTGGTGFFGCWLVETFLHANRELGLRAEITVLTRDPEAFAAKCPHLATDPALTLHAGDVRSFDFPAGDFRFVLHAATEASAKQMFERPLEMLSTIVEGTRRVLAFAAAHGTRKLLLTSSGAVYGPQPEAMECIPEGHAGAPNPLNPGSVYGEGKRMAEQLCAVAAVGSELECKVARCFAFVGPHLPLESHFAVGNFIADALAGRPIHIESDGLAVRSYLYASDLAAWLWTILFAGQALHAYNVGSEAAIHVGSLAWVVADNIEPVVPVAQAMEPNPTARANRYVPCTSRARTELGLRQTVTLDDALRRTAAWHRLK